MFERFTERARQVVVLAKEEARALKHNYTGTEHLLLGLLREEEGLAARALQSHGVTAAWVRQVVVSIVGKGEEATEGDLPFTPRAKRVCELALREALSLGHNYIGTEHLLLGLVHENEGVGPRVLADTSDLEKIRETVIALLSGRRQPPPPPAPSRSAARIAPVLRVIEEYWKAHPDLRLGQLIGDLASVAKANPYALEDGELLDAIWKAW